MIKKIASYFISLLSIIIIFKYRYIQSCIISTCNLFFYKVFPSLFPMLLISSLLINLNFIDNSKFIYKVINKIFNINNYQSYVLLISLISGSPTNAKVCKELYDQNILSRKDIEHILYFSHFSNPLFILSMVKHKPLLVLISHYIGNITIGILLKRKYKVSNNNTRYKNNSCSLTQIILNTMNTLLLVLGTIISFYILSSIINFLPFKILLELTQGINILNSINFNLKLKTMLIGSIISFGGFCIHIQVFGILENLKLKYTPYLLVRLLHSFITAICIFIFY